MSYAIFIIGLVCSTPSVYEQFETIEDTQKSMITQCKSDLKDCYNLTHDLKSCIKKAKEL